jgi:hypothetical protein
MSENKQATTILEAKVYQVWDDDMIYARNSVYKGDPQVEDNQY